MCKLLISENYVLLGRHRFFRNPDKTSQTFIHLLLSLLVLGLVSVIALAYKHFPQFLNTSMKHGRNSSKAQVLQKNRRMEAWPFNDITESPSWSVFYQHPGASGGGACAKLTSLPSARRTPLAADSNLRAGVSGTEEVFLWLRGSCCPLGCEFLCGAWRISVAKAAGAGGREWRSRPQSPRERR